MNSFFGKTGTRTLFTIECLTGNGIREMTLFPEEEEVLLLPGREFQVISCLDAGTGLYMIHLKETQPRLPHIAVVLPPAAKKSVSVEVSHKREGLTDDDLPRVMDEALIEKKYTSLDLSSNRVTAAGTTIIVTPIQNNKATV